MSHQNHNHTTPLPPSHNPATGGGRLPGNKFAALVGKYDHWTLQAERSDAQNKFHVYVWVAVAGGPNAGKYECAINVLSDKGTDSAQNEVRYHLHDVQLDVSHWPAEGISTTAALDYAKLGLHEADFTDVEAGELRTLVEHYASSCQLMGAFGHTYPDGTGLHETHMQSPNQDGAVVFYYDVDHGGPIARWVFVKFQTPKLP